MLKYRKISEVLFFSLIMVFIISNGCKTEKSDSLAKHVVLISIDGSRPEFYMDSSWETPNLDELRERGVYAEEGASCVFPSLTYPGHTSLITGADPIHHGIYFNKPFGAKPGHWNWNYNKIKTETLWDAVRDAGLTSGAVYWPVSVDAPVDYNFPSRNVEEGEEGDNLTIKYPFITPKHLLSDFTEQTGIKLSIKDLSHENYAYGKTVAELTNYMIKTYKPNFMSIRFFEVDHAEHAHGTNAPQVKDAVRVTDSLVGTVLDAVKEAGIWETTTVIIAGDHGHTDTKGTFSPNVYLAKHDLIKKDSWKAKFYATGGSAFLFLKDKNDSVTLGSIIEILKNTKEFKAGDFRILGNAKIKAMGGDPRAPLALAMREGITVSNKSDGEALQIYEPPYSRSTHGYDPSYQSMNTCFIAAGAGIASHKNIKSIGIEDISVVISQLLGLDFTSPDGKTIPGIVSQ